MKSIFRPAFGVYSTQSLFEIYNRWEQSDFSKIIGAPWKEEIVGLEVDKEIFPFLFETGKERERGSNGKVRQI